MIFVLGADLFIGYMLVIYGLMFMLRGLRGTPELNRFLEGLLRDRVSRGRFTWMGLMSTCFGIVMLLSAYALYVESIASASQRLVLSVLTWIATLGGFVALFKTLTMEGSRRRQRTQREPPHTP
jgi:hypothetical protein